MSAGPDAVNAAIDAALLALAKSAAEFAGKSEDVEHYREFMMRSIVSAPEQYTGEDFRPDVSLPFNAVAQLLNAIHRLQFELNHAGQYVDAHRRLERRVLEAWNIYTDPREAGYQKAALNKLGFKRFRRSRSRIIRDYLELRRSGVKPGKARELLAEKYNLSPESIRKTVQRHRPT